MTTAVMRAAKHGRFIEAMSKAIEAPTLDTFERVLLTRIFEALLRGEDVSDMIGTKAPPGAPPKDRTMVAVHYLLMTDVLRKPSKQAAPDVGELWGLKKTQVFTAVRENREAAAELVLAYRDRPADLLRLCVTLATREGIVDSLRPATAPRRRTKSKVRKTRVSKSQ